MAILGLAAAAVLAGARSVTAIAEWAADTPQPVRAALGARREAPNHWAVPAEATIRRTLGRLDANALATAIGAWLADRDRQQCQRRRRAVAVDGKTLRGARRAADGRQVHLLAAMDHATRAVLAQRQVDGAPGEVPAFQPLLADRRAGRNLPRVGPRGSAHAGHLQPPHPVAPAGSGQCRGRRRPRSRLNGATTIAERAGQGHHVR